MFKSIIEFFRNLFSREPKSNPHPVIATFPKQARFPIFKFPFTKKAPIKIKGPKHQRAKTSKTTAHRKMRNNLAKVGRRSNRAA